MNLVDTIKTALASDNYRNIQAAFKYAKEQGYALEFVKANASKMELVNQLNRVLEMESRVFESINDELTQEQQEFVENNVIPFAWDESESDIEDFRELLDNSYLDSPSLFDLQSFANQTIKRISQLSRDWCLRECRGFMSLFGNFYKLTTRTPRKVQRRAKRFIADICKASKGMLHAQYTRGV